MTFSHLKLSKKPVIPSSLSQVIAPLSELKEFNPALVYGFVAEDPQFHDYPKGSVAMILHIAGQLRDMQNAYFYAQDTILVDIRKNGLKTITPEKLGSWLNQLHTLIAKTIAEEAYTTPGVYCSEICRWKGKEGANHEFILQLSYGKADLSALARDNGFEKSTVEEFAKLFNNLFKKHGRSAFDKLLELHQNNKLTPEERRASDHIFFMAFPAEKLKMLMTVFLAEFAKKWQECDPKSDDEIAKLASYAYTKIAGKIHPYFNANGRLATEIVNIILRSFNKPSILVRYPHERHDPKSAYQITLKNADKDPEAFDKHFKNRMHEKTVYSDAELETWAVNRERCAVVYAKIMREFPQYDVDALEVKHNEEFNNTHMTEFLMASMRKISAKPDADMLEVEAEIHQEMRVLCLAEKWPLLEKTLQSLRNDTSLISKLIQHQQQSKLATAGLVSHLARLTGEKGWLVYGTDKPTVLLYQDDKTKAAAIVATLQKTQAMEVKLLENPSVIEIIEIDTNKLHALFDKKEFKSETLKKK